MPFKSQILVLPAVAWLLGACAAVKPSYHPANYFALAIPARAIQAGEPVQGHLLVESFTARERYEERFLTLRDSYQLTYDEYNRWVERPENLVAEALADALRAGNVFRRISSQSRAERPDYRLYGDLLAFERRGDEAVCSLALALYSERATPPSHWTRTFTVTKPLQGTGPAALAEGLSYALGDILQQAITDWRAMGLR